MNGPIEVKHKRPVIKEKVMAIKKCSCSHKVQDKMYGEGRRVHNPAPSKTKGGDTDYICTVCLDRKVK